MTPAELSEIEALTARGVPKILIAATLRLRLSDVKDAFVEGQSKNAIESYRQLCILKALADPYPEEAAEYLYVRSVPVRVIANVRLVKHNHEFGEVAQKKKAGYQAKQLELARARLRVG